MKNVQTEAQPELPDFVAARPPKPSDVVKKCRAAAAAIRALYAVDNNTASAIRRSLGQQLELMAFGGFSTAPIDSVEYPDAAQES